MRARSAPADTPLRAARSRTASAMRRLCCTFSSWKRGMFRRASFCGRSCERAEVAGEEAAAERAVRHEADAELAAHGQNSSAPARATTPSIRTEPPRSDARRVRAAASRGCTPRGRCGGSCRPSPASRARRSIPRWAPCGRCDAGRRGPRDPSAAARGSRPARRRCRVRAVVDDERAAVLPHDAVLRGEEDLVAAALDGGADELLVLAELVARGRVEVREPLSSAASSVARASSSFRSPYQPTRPMQPKPSAETRSPVLPRGRVCIEGCPPLLTEEQTIADGVAPCLPSAALSSAANWKRGMQ